MTVTPFKATDADEIELQDAQRSLAPYLDASHAQNLAAAGPAYTVRIGGRIALCGGLIEYQGGAHLWSMVSQWSGRHMLRLHGVVTRFLEVNPQPVVTATTDSDFASGCRWLELLGFRRERALPDWSPDGRDHLLYVRGIS